MVVDHIRAFRSKEFDKAGIVYVHFHQARARVNVRRSPIAQIVYDNSLMAIGHVCIDDMGADEPGTARDYDFHELPSPSGAFGWLLL